MGAVPAAAVAAGAFAPAAFADPIGDAAKKLGDASYPFAKSVDWNSALKPGEALKAIDKMIVMDVYNSVSSITDSGVPAYLKSGVSGADAAYSAFLEFKDVVKSNQVSSASGGASAPSGDAISAAAKKLSDASYP